MKPVLGGLILFALACLLAGVRCGREVPLGVDPRSDAAPFDAAPLD
ncbi:MAG TPA: hypothetical protein VHH90_09740 [Polyangia bacterium]|nr:hypothetical protein [Polyangia bacterium]